MTEVGGLYGTGGGGLAGIRGSMAEANKMAKAAGVMTYGYF